MSRDLTPKEMFLIDQDNIKHNRFSLFDLMKNSSITYGDKTWPMYTSEQIHLREQYPLLGKLFSDDFDTLHKSLSEIKSGLDLLQQKEEALQTYVDTGTGVKDSVLIKWFEGKLDENFYYSERNNEKFLDSVLMEATMNEIFEDVKRQIEAHENETSYGEPQAFYELPNGRTLEITLEQYGLPEEKQFYDVRLHCTEQEFDNHDFHAGNGVIAQYASENADINCIKSLLYAALGCNNGYPIAEHSRVQNADKPSLTDQIDAAETKTKSKSQTEKQTDITR